MTIPPAVKPHQTTRIYYAPLRLSNRIGDTMPLYLAEVYCKEGFRRGFELITGALSNDFPPGVTLKAGPWASNEEAKIILAGISFLTSQTPDS